MMGAVGVVMFTVGAATFVVCVMLMIGAVTSVGVCTGAGVTAVGSGTVGLVMLMTGAIAGVVTLMVAAVALGNAGVSGRTPPGAVG